MHATVLLRALGYTHAGPPQLLLLTETVYLEKGGKYSKSVEYELLAGQRATRDIKVGSEVIVKKNTKFTKAAIKKLKEAKLDRLPAEVEELDRQGRARTTSSTRRPARSSSRSTRR